jgi:hypothetical protein
VKIDVKQELKDFSGEPLKISEGSPNLTLKEVMSLSIKTTLQEDATTPLDKKIELDRIGEAIFKEEVDISVEQCVMIKERISKVFTAPAVAGAVRRAIEEPVTPKVEVEA